MDSMKRMERLEQLKREYHEIPVPEHGIDGVRTAMERARRKKRLKSRIISYASMAAAVVLVLFAVPEIGFNLFAGGAANESASKGYDAMVKDAINSERYDGAWNDSVQENVTTQTGQAKPTLVPGSTFAPESAEAERVQTAESFDGDILSDEAVRDGIKAEITRQIKLRGMGGEEAFVAMAASSAMLVLEEKEAYYYLDKKGQLVIVFLAGELAPENYGEIEFVIPDEVWK